MIPTPEQRAAMRAEMDSHSDQFLRERLGVALATGVYRLLDAVDALEAEVVAWRLLNENRAKVYRDMGWDDDLP